MMGALVFLLVTSWRNRLLMRVRRLRQPKYLVGAVVGLFYFLYVFSARFLFTFHARHQNGITGTANTPEDLVFKESLGALILFSLILLGWIIPHERAALVFTEAEVAFLFPAPISRKTLIHFKLLKSQVPILFTSIIFTLFFGWARGSGSVWTRALGWWIIFSTWNLHSIGSSFARTMLLDRGISNWKRRVLVFGLLISVAIGVGIWAWQTLPPPPASGEIRGIGDAKYYAEKVLSSGPLVWLLYPFRIVVRPYLAQSAQAFLVALGPALLLLLAHYIWVAGSDVAFEEASVEASRKMAERVAAVRSGKRHPFGSSIKRKRSPFRLGPTGVPAVAFLWKNLIGAGSGYTLRFWLLLIWIAGVMGWGVASNARTIGLATTLGLIALMLLAMSFLIGPQLVRQDFRQEIPMADVLKTYPLPAWQVALGELLAPAVILTAVQWCLIVLAAAMLSKFGQDQFPLDLRLSLAFSVAVLAPMLNMVSLVIPNSAVLLFPGWFQTGRDAPQGIEATGQRFVFAFGQFVVLLLTLIPAGLVFFLVWYLVTIAGIPLAIPLAAVASAIILAVEAGFGVALVGKLFMRFDISAEAAS
jgi:ABC-2 type transport system permease protein